MDIKTQTHPSLTPRKNAGGFMFSTTRGQNEMKCVESSVGDEDCSVKLARVVEYEAG